MSKHKVSKVANVTEMPIVEVHWVDAFTDVTAEAALDDDASEFGGLIECRDVGYLVRKSRKELVLAISYTPSDNSVRHSNSIPMAWVKRIIVLKPAEAAKIASRAQGKAQPEEAGEVPSSSK